MKSNYHYIIFILLIQSNILQAQISSQWNRESSYYTYKIINEKLEFKQVSFEKTLTKEEILDSLASYLSGNYFVPKNKYYENKAKISIAIDSIITFSSLNRQYRIGIANIKDPDKICMTIYFQGSTGGQNTFLMLVSNLLQPQLEYPLLDSIIFLYNNSELKNMDHIDLGGIISEREIDLTIRSALKK